ncbi:MAG: transglycosylase SLT domain-containing protein [Candidatus Methylumidiphilus sp.]
MLNIRLVFCCLMTLLASCASSPPSNTANVCAIFQEKEDWYASAKASAERWHVPVAVQMAIMNQESSFVDDARPERVRFLGIPLWRPTSAYGYSQATNQTWERYLKNTGHSGADRDDFADAADFVAWYVQQSASELGISKSDAYNQYLAYHEGQGGYRKGTWRSKPGLQKAARRVATLASRYQRQLTSCQAELSSLAEK